LINAKNRHGAIDTAEVFWKESQTLFCDISDFWATKPQPQDWTIPTNAARQEDLHF
jgi:hypothetical protein